MISDKQEKNIKEQIKSTLDSYIGENKYHKGVVMHLFMMFKFFLKDYFKDTEKYGSYNTDRTLDSFENELKLIRDNGFNPIAVTQLYFEDTFVFETFEEAEKAFKTLEENNRTVVGFWYDKYDFFDAVRKYEKDYSNDNIRVKIIWL